MNLVRTSQETHYVSATDPSRLIQCKIWGFHGGDYEECRLLGYKPLVRTSQETHYVSATDPSQLMLCKIWGFHGGNCDECHSRTWRSIAHVITDVLEERIASIMKGKRIGELGTTLTVSNKRSMLRRNTTYIEYIVFLLSVLWLLVTANVVPNSPILVTLIMEVIHSSETPVLTKPHGVTSHKMAFFIGPIICRNWYVTRK
jgi:hypothetical protein